MRDDNVATPCFIPEPLDKPVFEAADFDQDAVIFLELFEKLADFVRPRTDLSFERNVAIFISDADGKLLAMQIDSDV